METSKGIKFGGFVYQKIDKYRGYDHQIKCNTGIRDLKSFTFTFRDNKPLKFNLKSSYNESKPNAQFFLSTDVDWRLFMFGNCDIWIPKNGLKGSCTSMNESSYDHQGIENALVGQSGWDVEKGCFDLKRIVVLQFK